MIKDEKLRIDNLLSYRILDTLQEESFDRLTELASYICGTPIALISLIDSNRQWFKSKVGLDIKETSRDIVFCNNAIISKDIFEVENATKDVRFKDNPLVTNDPNIIFYAGKPLITPEGFTIGILCVIDKEPKKLNQSQARALELLSEEVIEQIIARKNRLILQENEISYTSLFENTTDLVHILDSNGNIIKVNNSWKKSLEYTEEEIKKIKIFDIISDECLEECKKYFETIINNNFDTSNKISYTLKSKSGKNILVEGSIIVEKENNKVRFIKSILRDISDKKEKEVLLKKSEEKFKSIYDLSPVGISLNDYENGAFLEANEAFLNSTKYTKNELLNLDYWTLTPKKYQEEEITQLKYLEENGKYGPYKKEFIRKDGTLYPVLLSGIKFINEEGKKIILSIVQDISKQQEYENNLKKSKEEALNASKAKSDFLANMSHEIRTPLNGIIGFTDLLMRTPMTEIQEQYMSTVYQSANSLLDLINDILDFSKIEAGKLELDIEKISLIDLCNQVGDISKYQAHKKGIELIINISSKTPEFIWGDKIRIRQILVNLISNSIKFTNNGEVELKIEVLENLNDTKTKLRISVIDTGIGIADENKQKIFEAFSQEYSSTTRTFGGTGLGLTISNNLLYLMGSKLELESNIGKGSIFYFDVVFDSEEVNDSKTINTKIDNVLIIDDNTSSRLVIKEFLNSVKINYKEATNGLEAIDIISKNNIYDVVIIDYDMPSLNGIETIKQIKQITNNSLKQSFILLYNSNEDEQVIKECEELNIRYKLVKPLKTNILFETLNSLQNKIDEKISIITNNNIVSNQNDLTNYNVLLAEDNPVNMMLMKSYFKNLYPDIKLLKAENGEEALNLFIQNRPDIILTDIQMPIFNGYELSEKVREIDKEVPIIALTAGTVKGEKEKCMEAGMNDYISKPVIQETLKKIIEFWLIKK